MQQSTDTWDWQEGRVVADQDTSNVVDDFGSEPEVIRSNLHASIHQRDAEGFHRPQFISMEAQKVSQQGCDESSHAVNWYAC